MNQHTSGMAKKTVTNPHGLPEIYARRQPKRPHFIREWMERRKFDTQSEFAEAIGADKSLVSRWLDDDDPSTPGRDWQEKLGRFFAAEGDDPVDIFTHPDEGWLRRQLLGRKPEEIERIKTMIEAAFPPRKQAN